LLNYDQSLLVRLGPDHKQQNTVIIEQLTNVRSSNYRCSLLAVLWLCVPVSTRLHFKRKCDTIVEL